jgi:hypothetical protein
LKKIDKAKHYSAVVPKGINVIGKAEDSFFEVELLNVHGMKLRKPL